MWAPDPEGADDQDLSQTRKHIAAQTIPHRCQSGLEPTREMVQGTAKVLLEVVAKQQSPAGVQAYNVRAYAPRHSKWALVSRCPRNSTACL